MVTENNNLSEPNQEDADTKRRVRKGFSISLVMLLLIAVFYFTNFKSVVVTGDSMEPTFMSGRRLLASDAYWLVGGLRPNDIVVIRGEKNDEYIIKRIYKVAGQKVDWANTPDDWSLVKGEFVVPEGHIFVLGDNRAVSEDSRRFGAVPIDRVLGKVVLK